MDCQLKCQANRRTKYSTDCSSLLEHAVEAESFVPGIIWRTESRHVRIELKKFISHIIKRFLWADWWGKVCDDVVFEFLFRGDASGYENGS